VIPVIRVKCYAALNRPQVPARGKALLKTDLAIAVPPGTYGRVGKLPLGSSPALSVEHNRSTAVILASAAPRSGLAWKNSIDVGAGVIGALHSLFGVQRLLHR
jgi:dUTP pyrophosphatase